MTETRAKEARKCSYCGRSLDVPNAACDAKRTKR